jgi:hypothetical protein
MSGSVDINTDVMRKAGQGLNQVQQQLDGEIDKLEKELESYGDAWGDDDIGQLIGVAYQEVVHWAFDCLKDVVNELCKSGEDLISQASQWEQKEQELTKNFDQLLSAIQR